ncbi:MAG TPA: hypothetical protein VE078_12070, partial [Thermoanaerobaculia bacterium]|nr:hypothetical protein [Thermoanaerobaculia bacterium]
AAFSIRNSRFLDLTSGGIQKQHACLAQTAQGRAFCALWQGFLMQLPGVVAANPGFLAEKSALVKAVWIVVPLILLLVAGGPVWRKLSSLARAIANRRFVALHGEAREFLELLNYSESLETKGSFSWKALSLERSRSLAARDLTLPGLTARYVEFVQSVRRHYNGKLVIAIDELDKIHDPEMVKTLLTEIKGALFTKGCYYLISISEDACRAFRQRLSSGRSIFESTFDDIVVIPQMTAEAASTMISRRLETSPETARIPSSCHFVLALAGGGIPREIVRHLRAVSLVHEGDADKLEPGPVAAEILRLEIEAWAAGLAEVDLSGEETIALRAEAEEILTTLLGAETGKLEWGRVWEHLERCLNIIDSANLRRSMGTPEAVLRYRAIVDDIQSCLRLMILTTVCELAGQGDTVWKKHETALLAAYRALAEKPALAETLLSEIRTAHGL